MKHLLSHPALRKIFSDDAAMLGSVSEVQSILAEVNTEK
jgi:hypothetical protein